MLEAQVNKIRQIINIYPNVYKITIDREGFITRYYSEKRNQKKVST